MIAAIIPQFFTTALSSTLRYHQEKLGFDVHFVYGEPAFYAAVIRDSQSLFFRVVDSLPAQAAVKYAEEYLDAYFRVESVDDLYAEYQSRQVTFARELSTMPWGVREFVVKDVDGRLLCFGESLEKPV